VIRAPDDAAVFDAVSAIIREVLRRPDLQVTPQTTARDVPGWDSFAMVAMIVAVQDRFAIELETEALDEIGNVGDLVRAIAGSAAS
jgi:acyl carrier protein